ncbi:hypothetical protein GLAREA_11621 [Glarea lozoyensis ATCC 20868]|uniref:Uncharacterized protein n=1 Tax=Glarea lozoyensis (strain ATCC 20868 / MF5171) TaxID=1116229 RepID=S3CGL2_GLAL2|nr:uncharacterized protein GLAREA_11621 [Glarea lozoyensis ATCC 20868]EPE25040.1 hypothetical protein GLAREA_11621 [Glarea lozoyensis ATCC 20868]
MRPATPNFNFAQQAGPSSPPQTPNPANSAYSFGKNRRHGQHFQKIPPELETGILPNGPGPTFSYMPTARAVDLSPRSSSPTSSVQSSASGNPPRSMSSSPVQNHKDDPPLRKEVRLAEGTFTIDEFEDSDYADFDSDEDSVIRPHEYEDAESERALSVKAASELEPSLYDDMQNLHCETDDILPEELEREAWHLKMRAEKRRKRRSSGSVQKRTLSQSIGSDTDDEDIQPVTFEGANSARRLRRKVEDRGSLIFDDPPPRIDELEEPESCEELVEVTHSDIEGQGLRELPYYVQDMDVDSEDEDEYGD